MFVSVSRDKTIRIWEKESGFCKRTVSDAHEDWIRCCDANEKYLITSGNDKKVFVFEIEGLLTSDKQGRNK